MHCNTEPHTKPRDDITRVETTITTPDSKWSPKGQRMQGPWKHRRRNCSESAEGNVASSLCWGWKQTQTETEVFVRHQRPLVGHINRSVCLNSAPCIPSGYLWLEIEVGCHHGVRASVCVALCVSAWKRTSDKCAAWVATSFANTRGKPT